MMSDKQSEGALSKLPRMPLRTEFFQSRFSADFRELDVGAILLGVNFKPCADGLGNVNCQCVATPRCEFHITSPPRAF